MPSRKKPEKYNSRDLLTYWKELFDKKTGKEYISLRYGGLDLSDLKTLLLENDVFEILLAMQEGILHETILGEFCENFEDYMSDSSNPRLEWLVLHKGKKAQKTLWDEYEQLSFMWFPTGSQAKRMGELEQELEEWAK